MSARQHLELSEIVVIHGEINKEHSDYNSQGLDCLHAVEEKHFWFISRKEFIFHQLKKFVDKTSKLIEVGAGTGNVSRYLMQRGFSDIAVGEMHLNGLEYARDYGVKECYQFDLLEVPFESEFDAVGMFDVLEHIENDVFAITNVHKMLKSGGYVVLTVPAHMWLWSRDDNIAGHKRRYTRKELVAKLENGGFEVLDSRYFFVGIVPLLLLRRIVNRDTKKQIETKEYKKVISINPILNKFLLFSTRIENKIASFLPNFFGGSLYVIGRKN